MNDVLLELKDIVVFRHLDPRGLFGLFGAKPIRALDGVSLTLRRGETLGIMGGSGSGKSTLAEAATLRCNIDRGRLLLQGKDITKMSGADRKRLRGKLAMIRQDARESLDMKQNVRRQLQGLLGLYNQPHDEARLAGALEQVGLPADFLNRTPEEMSGGQQQRLAIARALVLNPILVAADEPVSGVDPRLQLEMLGLMERAQKQRNISYLLISQERKVISRLAHRTAMLYAGRLFEVGSTDRLMTEARHPYSRLFLGQEGGTLPADEDTAGRTLTGCPWAGYCPAASDVCRRQMPGLKEVAPGHAAACHAL